MALEFSQLLSLYQSEVFQCLLCHSLLYTSRVHISLSVLDTDLRSQQAASESLNKNHIGKFSFFWTLNFVWLFSDRHAQACKMSRHWLVYKGDRWCIPELKQQLNVGVFLRHWPVYKGGLWCIPEFRKREKKHPSPPPPPKKTEEKRKEEKKWSLTLALFETLTCIQERSLMYSGV